MPTFDGGHCFLTTLIPIDSDDVVTSDGLRCSHVQLVRELLAKLPTARQSPETEGLPDSPFAKCLKTHLARLVVLDDLIFNGRMPSDALLSAPRGEILTDPQPVDSLPGPYLLFTADFDAPHGTGDELRAWLREVYAKMQAELGPVFAHCFRYAAKVKDEQSFADYMIAHRIETTMPFNDYGLPPLPSAQWPVIGGAAAAALVVGGGIWLLLHAILPRGGWWIALVVAISLVAAIAAAVAAVYLVIMRAGAKPFPPAQGGDLPSVLKALYLQRRVIPQVAAWQGATPEELYAAVGKFLEDVQIENLESPSQVPGTIAEVR